MAKKKQAERASLFDELDPPFQRLEWFVQRLLWAAIAIIIAAALLGFVGNGPLARTTTSATANDGTIEVGYARVARFHAPQYIEVVVDAPGTQGDTLEVALDAPFAESSRSITMEPEPESTTLRGGAASYAWNVADWSQPVRVAIRFESDDIGPVDAVLHVTVGDANERTLRFRQFVLP
jgi:hypothetical protein